MAHDDEPDRQILITALISSFGEEKAQEILEDEHAYSRTQPAPGPVWLPLGGCWMFGRWGMFIGVERDGYVHS